MSRVKIFSNENVQDRFSMTRPRVITIWNKVINYEK